MKCVFCAEEIQDAAILCRFCGAQKHDGVWSPAPWPPATRSGTRSVTLLSSGWLMLISALLEMFWITSPVPVVGAMRGGVFATLYHLVFAALFVVMGGGLIARPRWGAGVVLIGTSVCSLDRVLFLADVRARQAYVQSSFGGPHVLEVLGSALLDRALVLGAILTLCAWVGFAVYVYRRRTDFQPPVAPRARLPHSA